MVSPGGVLFNRVWPPFRVYVSRHRYGYWAIQYGFRYLKAAQPLLNIYSTSY